MGTDRKLRLADVLVKENILTEEQLVKIVQIQSQMAEPRSLRDLCIEFGLISKSDLKELLQRYHSKMYIGELFMSLGLVNEKDLEKALLVQKGTQKRLGEVLIEMGIVSEEDLAETLSFQLGIPKIDPEMSLMDRGLVKRVNEKYLKKNLVIPAFKEDDTLTVIMEDPLETESLKYFSDIFSCKVQAAIATPMAIKRALYELFDKPGSTEEGPYSQESVDSNELIIGDVRYTYGSDRVVDIVNYLISRAIMEEASDIHIEPQSSKLQVRFRIDGILHHKTDLPLSLAPSLASRIKVLCGLDIAEKRKHQDGRIGARVLGKEIDLRVSTYASIHGETVVIRILHRRSNLINLHRLGFSPSIYEKYEKILNYPSGIILVTGPTGSGKTTTLYASLDYLNDLERKIITVEDPIEYTIPGVVQANLNPKIGMGYVDFLKSMMRQDPDVIMIGEIRERESAEITIQAALTGHKVFTTFHTEDTTSALIRLMDMGIETFLISSTVVSVLSQRLVRLICNECKERYDLASDLFRSFRLKGMETGGYTFFKGVGCPRCNHTGFKGRTGIYELLIVNDDIRNAILARKTTSEIRQIAREKIGLISMKEDGFYKAVKGLTTLEEVLRVVYYNESDEFTGRTPEEIVYLCEEEKEKGLDTIDSGALLSKKPASPRRPA